MRWHFRPTAGPTLTNNGGRRGVVNGCVNRDQADAIQDAITAAALPQGTTNHPCSYDDSRIGGPLLFVNATAFKGDGSCEIAS